MTLPYKRSFKVGRQSEQFLNDQLHSIFEALKNINYRKNENKYVEPESKIDGALWFDKVEDILKYYDMRTLSWKTMFSKKFQITDQILNITMPSNPVNGQLWIYNGVLMYFDGASWQPIKAMIQDDTQWSNAAFQDYMIVTPLNASGDAIVNANNGNYDELIKKINHINDDDHTNNNVIVPADKKWTFDDWNGPEIKEPTYDPGITDKALKSQYIVPNLDTDRIFINENHDTAYEKISKVCFQYPTIDVYDKIVSAIHLNPGKLSKITKRLIKIDKVNSTINVPAYNTEFYGFKKGEYTGDFLLESSSQDYGDYIPNGDYILLNYNATQNYDYILAITFEFAWMKSNGSMEHWDSKNPKKSYYLTDLKSNVNVHVEGLKLEETVYDVDLKNNTVTINDSDITDKNLEVQMWSPYDKQFGYIRETDLEGNGLIKLTKNIAVPLVFVGGMLIHPLYGGLKRYKDKIIVPNHSGLDTMKNMHWCVVDLYSKEDQTVMYSEKGEIESQSSQYILDNQNYFEDDETYVMHGTVEDIDSEVFKNYILASGTVYDSENALVIKYDTSIIEKNDGIILFIDGLMISEDDIIRDTDNGTITLKTNLEKGQQYVLLRDRDKRLYSNINLTSAFSTGYLNESLVYLNGKLLVNENCVNTTNNENDEIINGSSVNNEIKYFITDEFAEDDEFVGDWKLYDEYNYEWISLDTEEVEILKVITGSYSNQLSSIKINVDYTTEDQLDVYSFNFSNAISGILKFGEAVLKEIDQNTGAKIYALGSDSYPYGQNAINIYRNGVKQIPNIDYIELEEHNYIKIINDTEDTDRITYIIEPIEAGETFGHETILLTKEDALQPNIYHVEDSDSAPNFYPGRLTVYINGLRLPAEDWVLLDNKRIMLKYVDYRALGSADNYPVENFVNDKNRYEVNHNYPDYIMVEIRKDYDRQEATIVLSEKGDNFELYLDDYNSIDPEILESSDEVLFYLNGQFTNLSRNKYKDYKLDRYKGCISFSNTDFLSIINTDALKSLFDNNALIYAAWKKLNKKDEYVPEKQYKLTLVWR